MAPHFKVVALVNNTLTEIILGAQTFTQSSPTSLFAGITCFPTPSQALLEPFPTFSKHITAPRILIELSGNGPRRIIAASTGKMSFTEVQFTRRIKALTTGLKPARFPTNVEGLPGWGANVKAGFARTHKYEAPPRPIPAVPVVELPSVTSTPCYKVVACVASRYIALNSYTTSFIFDLTTKSSTKMLAFTTVAAATTWLQSASNLSRCKHEGAPKAILSCEAVGPVTVSSDGTKLTCRALRTVKLVERVGNVFVAPAWEQKNKSCVNKSNKSRVVNVAKDGGKVGVGNKNGEQFGFPRAVRAGTAGDYVSERGHIKNRKREKGVNSFPKWWLTDIKK